MSSEWSRVLAAANFLKVCEEAGMTPSDVSELTYKERELVSQFVGVLRGTHRIVEIPLLTPIRNLTTSSARPTVAGRGSQFKEWFDGVEEGARSETLTLQKLERLSPDAPIIKELGGEEAAEVCLADFYAALAEKEARKDFTWLIAYMKDKTGTPRAVHAAWRDDGWIVHACSVEAPYDWNDGIQVLSRPDTKA